jgi:hypothetical protein
MDFTIVIDIYTSTINIMVQLFKANKKQNNSKIMNRHTDNNIIVLSNNSIVGFIIIKLNEI